MESSTSGFGMSKRPRVGGWIWGANPFSRRGIPLPQSSATSLLLLHPPSALPHMLSSLFIPSCFFLFSAIPPITLSHMRTHLHTSHISVWGGGSSAAGSTWCSTWAKTPADSWVTPFLLQHHLSRCSPSFCPVIPSSLVDHLSIVPAQPRRPFAPSSSPRLRCVTLIPRLLLYWLLLRC